MEKSNSRTLINRKNKSLFFLSEFKDDRFELAGKFKLSIPADCNFITYIDNFGNKYSKQFVGYSSTINRSLITSVGKLRSGKKYDVVLFKVKKQLSHKDCYELLSKQDEIMNEGIRGAMFAWEFLKEKLPRGLITFFSVDNGGEQVAQIYKFEKSDEYILRMMYLMYMRPGDYFIYFLQK